MHGDGWDHDWGGWWWISMAVMMIAFWGGVAWVIVTIVRHGAHTPDRHHSEPTPPTPPPLTPTEILAERLARGEINVDEYRQRLAALQDQRKD